MGKPNLTEEEYKKKLDLLAKRRLLASQYSERGGLIAELKKKQEELKMRNTDFAAHLGISKQRLYFIYKHGYIKFSTLLDLLEKSKTM